MLVEVYGHPHSPWVQAVLMGLHEKGVNHQLRTSPPLSYFAARGIWMPAARFDGGDWQTESANILQQVGFRPLTQDEVEELNRAWQGVLHRTDRPFRFFRAFSQTGDPNPCLPMRWLRNYLRSFATLYFFTLIRFRVLTVGYGDPENLVDQFLPWEKRLEGKVFLAGDQPGTADLTLFGIVQCHSSIRVPPLEVLEFSPQLGNFRSWISRMQTRFADYPYLYSAPLFEPRRATLARASLSDQLAFWLGSITWIALLPLSLALVFVLMRRRPR